jgi:CubicO group peptidase (beta-lactamase class C family)
MDSAKLQAMMDLIDEQNFAYDSILVIRNGHIVFEQYRNGYDQNRKHHLQSVTKSFSSMLIGIAIHEGLLGGIQQKMVELFPDHTMATWIPEKRT